MKENAIKVLAIGMILLLMFMALAAIPMNMGAKKETPKALVIPVNTTEVSAEIYEHVDETSSASTSSNSLNEITPYWVDMVDAEEVDVSNEGEGVYVAVLDTGLVKNWEFYFSHADIATEYGKGFTHDYVWEPANDPNGEIVGSSLRDDRGFITKDYGHGHGTHVTSTIVGYYFWYLNSIVRGVAPKVTIIPVLVLDTWMVDCPNPDYPGCHDGKVRLTGGTWEMVSAGIKYVADLSDELDGPVIISMSLGGSAPSEMLEDAIDYAIGKGVTVIASAGNNRDWGMGWPGAFSQVISVGAAVWPEMWYPDRYFWRGDRKDFPEDFNTEDAYGNNWQLGLASFSSRPNMKLGQKATDLDVCAPGVYILGPYQNNVYWDGAKWVYPTVPYYQAYYWVHGTSMAAPHVSAIAAMVLYEHPDLSQKEMEFILKLAARGLPFPADGALIMGSTFEKWHGNDWGAGFLQADAALKTADTHTKK